MPLVLQGKSKSIQIRCGGKYNIRFVSNFLTHVIVKNYEHWFTNKKVISKIKMVPNLSENRVYIVTMMIVALYGSC